MPEAQSARGSKRDYFASIRFSLIFSKGRSLELSSKHRHHLENIDIMIIVISNMCAESASTATVGVVSETREIISRIFVLL